MNKTTTAYILVFLVAFVAAIFLVQVSQTSRDGESNALEVLPADINLLLFIDKPAQLLDDFQLKMDGVFGDNFNIYQRLFDLLPLSDKSVVTSAVGLEEKLGICLSAPAGLCQIDNTDSSNIIFFSIKNRSIFEKYARGLFQIEDQIFEDNKYLLLTSQEENISTLYLYFKDSTAFILTNHYYLKKLLRDDEPRFSENTAFYKFREDHPDSMATCFFNTGKIATSLANILSFIKPNLAYQFKSMGNNSELGSEKTISFINKLADGLILLLKSQKSVYSTLTPTDMGYFLDSEARLKLSEATQKVFVEKSVSNPLIQYLPVGSLFTVEDNSTRNQTDWFSKLFSIKFENEKETEEDSKIPPKHTVFSMFSSNKLQSPFYQLVLTADKDVSLEEEKMELFEINKIFESIKMFLPLNLRFTVGSLRNHNGIDIQRFFLKMEKNLESIFNLMMKAKNANSPKAKIPIPPSYPFEIAKTDHFTIFAGGDKTENFMNDMLKKILDKKDPKIVESSAYKSTSKARIKSATVNIYINFSNYVATILSLAENANSKGEGRVEILLPTFKENWSVISYKLRKYGLETRFFINTVDLAQMAKAIKSIEYLEK